jgi:hypothetical protein
MAVEEELEVSATDHRAAVLPSVAVPSGDEQNQIRR